MEKINFINNQTPAGASTMTTFQNNIENAINEVSAIQIGTITPKAGVAISGQSLKKINNRVCLQIALSTTSQLSSTTIATIPSAFAPKIRTYATVVSGGALDFGIIDQSGNILSHTTLSSGKDFNLLVVYDV